MSHSSGYVLFKDGTKFYYEYNGTADVVLPKLWKTMQEVTDHWREEEPFDKECICKQDEEVIMYTRYGNGWYFPGRACKKCMLVTNSPSPYENMVDGEPVIKKGE